MQQASHNQKSEMLHEYCTNYDIYQVKSIIIDPLTIIRNLLSELRSSQNILNISVCNASRNGHVQVVKIVLENGADIHAREDEPLRVASEKGHTEIVKLLLQHGADIHAREDYPLRVASEKGFLLVFQSYYI